jgi:hypothetical protein
MIWEDSRRAIHILDDKCSFDLEIVDKYVSLRGEDREWKLGSVCGLGLSSTKQCHCEGPFTLDTVTLAFFKT